MNFISKLLTASQTSRYVVFTSCRSYPRWTSRTPLRVLSLEEEEQLKDESKNIPATSSKLKKNQPLEDATKINWRFQVDSSVPNQDEIEVMETENLTKTKKPKPFSKPTNSQKESTDMLETVINEKGQIVYTKMKNNDSRVGQLLTTVKTKKQMTTKDLILLEGKRLIRDALLAGCSLKFLLFTRKAELEFLKADLPRSGAKMYKMPYKEMQMWSDLTTSPGIMALFRTPQTEKYVAKAPIPLSIYCDNVREPSNLGAILRVAASAGCAKVMLSPGCTNLWDSKVTRSSAGAHFRVRILPKKRIQDLRAELSDPCNNKMLFIADNNLLNMDNNMQKTDMLESDVGELQTLINQIPIIPYYGMNVRESTKEGREIILVIGGETQGVHADVYKLAQEFNGVRLNIPMNNGVDSLNTGTAVGVIAFEFYRQFMTGGTGSN